MITWENYEEYMMLHADGELKPAEEQELMSFIYEHPELANELAAFSMSKMIPDTTMVYANKESLLKKGPGKVVAFPHWQRYAVAAGVAALLFVAGVQSFYNSGHDKGVAVVANDSRTGTQLMKKNGGEDDRRIIIEKTKPQQNVAAIVSPQNTNTLPAKKTTRVKQATAKQKSIRLKPETTNAVVVVKEVIEYVPAEYIGLANMNNGEKYLPVAVTNVPPAAIQIEEEQSKSLLDKLPIDELKKNGIKNVATAMASGYDKVNAIRQGINEASISVRVEKRKLILSF